MELNFAAPESAQSLKPNKKTKVTWQLRTFSAGTAVMVQVKARFLHVSSEDSPACNKAILCLDAKIQLPLLNLFLSFKSYHPLTFPTKASVSVHGKEPWIGSEGLLHGDLVCVTEMPVHPINQITRENSSQEQHLVGCCCQEVSEPQIQTLQSWKFLLRLFEECGVVLWRDVFPTCSPTSPWFQYTKVKGWWQGCAWTDSYSLKKFRQVSKIR